MINRPRSDTANVFILSALAILVLVAGCSDSSEPVTPPAPELTVFGGPDNPASDGSYTAEIVSVNGIATLETVSLGGVDQWVMIRGYDVDNPVLVFLHGGPGSPAIPYARFSFGGLEQDFTVVSWDQRGCGKSYDEELDPSSITLDRMLADTHELIELMQVRFGVQRIYLMGASWGSILGTLTARDHPELLHAYIGVGQVVNYTNSIPIAHAAALDRATALGLDDAIAVHQHQPVHRPYKTEVVVVPAHGPGYR